MTRISFAIAFIALQLVGSICHGQEPQTNQPPILQVRVVKHPEGQLKKQYWYYANDKRDEVLHGPYLSWHKGGQIADQGAYSHGKRHGIQVYYDKHGKPWQLMEMKKGVPHGRHIEWYPNGALRLEYTFQNGKRSGPFTKWGSDGTISEQGNIEAP